MKTLLLIALPLLLKISVQAKDTRCYEMRVYTANKGKLDELNARFKNHTCKLFEKHGLINVGYWVPAEKSDNRLIYVISSPDRETHSKSWKAFLNDPDWKKAYKASVKNGALVAKIESTFLKATDYSPEIKSEIWKHPRVFELRTYVTAKDRLKNLNARFRDHTCTIFEKHNMTNVAYWTPIDANKGKDNTLIYIISHKSTDQAKKNWGAFINDPAWKKARAESIRDGKILAKAPHKVFMEATDYSLIK